MTLCFFEINLIWNKWRGENVGSEHLCSRDVANVTSAARTAMAAAVLVVADLLRFSSLGHVCWLFLCSVIKHCLLAGVWNIAEQESFEQSSSVELRPRRYGVFHLLNEACRIV